jgi:hypothetical protein
MMIWLKRKTSRVSFSPKKVGSRGLYIEMAAFASLVIEEAPISSSSFPFEAAPVGAAARARRMQVSPLLLVLTLVDVTAGKLSDAVGRCVLRTRRAISLVGDDTLDGHRGKKVFGKGRHVDAVRSSQSYAAFRYGL